jgi:hypothetical protein
MTLVAPVPFLLKLVYSGFMAVLVPVYWYHYGPTNFLFFCDVALFIFLVGIWREDRLLVSIATVGILGTQTLWVMDFLGQLAGLSITGMTAYMFEAQRPLYLRGLSLFHGWLPFLGLFLVWRLGYDRRAFWAWTCIAWALILVCYFFIPGPTPVRGIKPVNINYVYGFSADVAQSWMPGFVWLALEMIALPLLLYFPAHLLLRSSWFRRGSRGRPIPI